MGALLKGFKSYWPFVLCLESNDGDFDVIGQQCASKTKVDFDSIKACVNGAEGNAAEHKMAVKTENLNPPHQCTPWIVVNGKHNEIIQRRAQMNLVKYVCEEYTVQSLQPAQSTSKKNLCDVREIRNIH